MRNFIITLMLITCNTIVIAQTKKTYNGVFENGKAIYQYFENNDLERIFDGSFSYTASINSIRNKKIGVENDSYLITGQYKNNMKNGMWSEKKTYSLDGNGNNYLTNIFSGNYENGLKVGKWTYNSKGVKDSKTYEKITYFNYNKNILIGKIFSEGHIDGSINNDGVFQGIWNIKTQGREYIAEFANGIFIKLIVRKIENGDILFKYLVSEYYKGINDSLTLKATLKQNDLELSSAQKQFSGYAFGNKQPVESTENKNEDEESEKNKYEQLKQNLYDLIYFEEFMNYVIDFGSSDIKIEHGSEATKIINPSVILFKN